MPITDCIIIICIYGKLTELKIIQSMIKIT